MANTFKVKSNAAMPASTGTPLTIYTVPSSTTTVVIGLTLCNVHSTSVTASVKLDSNTSDTETNETTQKIESIWMNTNSYKDSNRVHNHPGSAISGVYYVKAPSSAGNIVFQHPSMNELGFYYNSFQGLPGDVNEPEEYNQYNTSLVKASAIENTLYLFPSWLMHYVESNMNKTEERISISFNISPSK